MRYQTSQLQPVQLKKKRIYLVIKDWEQKELGLGTMRKLVNLFITRVEIRNSETTLHAC